MSIQWMVKYNICNVAQAHLFLTQSTVTIKYANVFLTIFRLALSTSYL